MISLSSKEAPSQKKRPSASLFLPPPRDGGRLLGSAGGVVVSDEKYSQELSNVTVDNSYLVFSVQVWGDVCQTQQFSFLQN